MDTYYAHHLAPLVPLTAGLVWSLVVLYAYTRKGV